VNSHPCSRLTLQLPPYSGFVLDDWEQLSERLQVSCEERLAQDMRSGDGVGDGDGGEGDGEDGEGVGERFDDECVIEVGTHEWNQIARNFEAARRTSSAARSDEWG
jgi:hypothetical protein